MYDLSQVEVASSPHIHSGVSTRGIMLDVMIALLPALAVAVFTFGVRSLLLTLLAAGCCVLFEFTYQKLLRQPVAVGDLSAAVTGMLLAYNLSPAAAWWLVVVGSFFAIVVVKLLFGGLGRNFMNPALAGRAFLLASFPVAMSRWAQPGTAVPLLGGTVTDAVSGATPLASLKSGALPTQSLLELLFGQTSGCIGEVSKLALLAGGLYLLYRKVITIRIPAAYLLSVAVLTFLFPQGGADRLHWMLAELLSGGVVLGAFFMATDYTTSPVTSKGQVVFGIGCGVLTVFLRYYSGLPEGVTYAILLMNVLVWQIDRVTRPRKFGYAGNWDGQDARPAKKEVK